MKIYKSASKQDPRWPDAHGSLKRLYEQRVPEAMSQEDFGRRFGIGTSGMVWQYLNGYRPLNFEAAAKFAKGLNCTIQDISPQMAQTLRADIVSVLGRAAKVLGKAAVLTLFVALAYLCPTPAHAADFCAPQNRVSIMTNSAARWLCALITKLVRFLTVRIHDLQIGPITA